MNVQVSSSMTAAEMREVIRSVKPSEQFQITFADNTSNRNLKGPIYWMLAAKLVEFAEAAVDKLMVVVETSKWEGSRTFLVTALATFDPDKFIIRTVDRSMLESVHRLG